MKVTATRRKDNEKGLRRHRYFFPRKNRECLVGLRRDRKNWRVVVEVLCRQYNYMHATKNKCCSFQTSADRKKFYLKFFEDLAVRCHIDPRELKSKHVLDYYRRFVFEGLNKGVEQKALIKHIKTEAAYLAFFAWWIGKPNSIPTASQIIEAQGERLSTFEFSNFRAGVGRSEDLIEKVAHAFKTDPYLALQMSVMGLFGLRTRESVALRVSESFGTENGLPCLRIVRGSKGGKPRQIILKDKGSIEGFKYLWNYCLEHSINELCWPDADLDEGVRRQANLFARKYKLKKDAFVGSSHSFRHSFAVRMMQKSVDSGPAASLAVSEVLGHHRAAVTAVYVGNAERGGEETIGPLLKSLVEEPQGPRTSDRLMMLLRELLVSRTALGFSLIHWISEEPTTENELNDVELRESTLVPQFESLLNGNEILLRLKEWLEEGQAKRFLIQNARSQTIQWVKKNVLAPFDVNVL